MEKTSQEFLEINRSINLLYNEFYLCVADAIHFARPEGYKIDVFEGWRSPQRQQELYLKTDKKVTNASAWNSWHQYGLAVDIAFKDDNNSWTWDRDFKLIVPYFENEGLVWGGPGDQGHFEWPMQISHQEAREIVQDSGLQALWLLAAKAIGKQVPAV